MDKRELKIDYFVYKLYKNSFVQNVNMFALCIEKNAKIRIIIIEARDGKQNRSEPENI